MTLRHRRQVLLAIAALLLLPLVVFAQPTAYAVQSDGDDQLYSIDLATGIASAIGATGFADIDSLTLDPAGTTLYGVDSSSDQLLTCDATTGACTAVGPLGVATSATGLTFGCDGNLYLGDEGSQGLYLVDSTTGTATLLGASGEDLTALAARTGDGTCPSGVFGVGDDATDSLVCLDTATGAATAIGLLGVAISDGGLDFDAGGTLWLLDDDGNLYTVEPATGAATAAPVTTDAGFEGLAIAAVSCEPPPPSVLEIPTLSTWGALALAALLLLSAAVALRRGARRA